MLFKKGFDFFQFSNWDDGSKVKYSAWDDAKACDQPKVYFTAIS